jgi:hypothetical protein
VPFTISKSSPSGDVSVDLPTLEKALKVAASVIDGKSPDVVVRILDMDRRLSYDEGQILRLLRNSPANR